MICPRYRAYLKVERLVNVPASEGNGNGVTRVSTCVVLMGGLFAGIKESLRSLK